MVTTPSSQMHKPTLYNHSQLHAKISIALWPLLSPFIQQPRIGHF